MGHPYTLARGLYWNIVLHQFRREWQIVQERAEAAIPVAAEHQIALVSALGPIMRGWALAMQGQGAEELIQIRQGIDDYRATGTEFQRPQFLAMLAEVYATVGQPEEALPLITEALSLVKKMGER